MCGTGVGTGKDGPVTPLLFRVRVIGPSMEPSLSNGQVVWARRGGVRPGRLVVFEEPGRPGLVVVKRACERRGDGWWVEGDNPDASTDSRTYGPIDDAVIWGSLIGRR